MQAGLPHASVEGLGFPGWWSGFKDHAADAYIKNVAAAFAASTT